MADQPDAKSNTGPATKQRAVVSVLVSVVTRPTQWRRNEFEIWGALIHPYTFLALNVQLVVLVSAYVMPVQFGQFLVCCSSTHGAPPHPVLNHYVKVGARATVPFGVGATCPTYSEKFMRDDVVAPFVQLSGCHCTSATFFAPRFSREDVIV